jgi:adenylate cyclase class 2
MSTENAVETEVKIPVPLWTYAEASARFQRFGLNLSVPRVFESNWVFDTPSQTIRNSQMLLRLRRVDEQTILTWKGPPVPGPHKSRPELEVHLDSFDTMRQILVHLGYQPNFRYDKYRTEFQSDSEGTVTFDETPIGNYLELEGKSPWIDETAMRLGFSKSDYVLDSYAKLYLAHCATQGMQPLNMVFPATS